MEAGLPLSLPALSPLDGIGLNSLELDGIGFDGVALGPSLLNET